MWWEIHDKGAPELQHGVATQILFDQGHQVGALARDHVPGGILIQRDKGNFVTSFAQSREAIADPSIGVIYEAGFVAHDTMIFADILVRGEDGFTLIEVKSGTSVTEEHIYDLGVQAVVPCKSVRPRSTVSPLAASITRSGRPSWSTDPLTKSTFQRATNAPSGDQPDQ